LSKVRIYELAKEMNTNSKRVMEKLEEIDIHVKNHMSFLTDEELKKLYDHIGIVKREEKKPEPEKTKTETDIEKKAEIQKKIKSMPRIIRKTEIIVDTKEDGYIRRGASYNKGKNNKQAPKKSYVSSSGSQSGLKAGYIRDTGILKKAEILRKAELYKKAADEKHRKDEEAKKEARKKEELRKEMMKVAEKAEKEKEVEAKETVKAKKAEPVKTDIADKTDTKKVDSKEKEKQLTDKIVTKKNEEKKVIETKVKKEELKEKDNKTKPDTDKPKVSDSKTRSDVRKPVRDSARPQRDGTRPQRDSARPKRDSTRPQRDSARPQRDSARPQRDGARPQSQGDRPKFQGNRPQGSRPQGARPQGSRPGFSSRPNTGFRPTPRKSDDDKDLDIIDDSKKREEAISQRGERRALQKKDRIKIEKAEKRRQASKAQIHSKDERFDPKLYSLGEKKGVKEVMSEEFIMNEFYSERENRRRRKAEKARREAERLAKKHVPKIEILTNIKVPEILTVKEFSEKMKKTSTDVIKVLMKLGVLATINQEIDFDTAVLVADEFSIKVEKEITVKPEEILFDENEIEVDENVKERPPVVVVMGHVDHGKTSLLDAIRETNVTEGEAGGITQHIGAYMVDVHGRKITFLDTPGHEAFTSMRARGAMATDIAVLVVAADDGIMPQTVEAINHAKAAGVSIIVAVNKIDKPGANPDRILQGLTEHELLPEAWGGETVCVNVSALTGENIDGLMEMILLTADMLELKANPEKQVKGIVIESKLDKGRGPVATLLVQRGTFKAGDFVISGTTVGRVRVMSDDKGKPIDEAGPSTPVEVTGFDSVPEAGDVFYVVEDEKLAKQLADSRKSTQRHKNLTSGTKVSLEDLFSQIQEGQLKDLNIIVKADVQGSVEAVKQALEKLENEEVKVKVVHGGVGAVSESDITLAEVTNAIIIGFNVRPGINIPDLAKEAGVDMRMYRVIYEAIDDIRAAMKGMLEPKYKEVTLGQVEIRQTFKASGIGTIGGSYVLNGKIKRDSKVRIVRDGVVIHEGSLASLKRFKDDVKEVLQGYECGISIEGYNDIKESDVIEAYEMQEIER
jgi:translation initiation factor IF-2